MLIYDSSMNKTFGKEIKAIRLSDGLIIPKVTYLSEIIISSPRLSKINSPELSNIKSLDWNPEFVTKIGLLNNVGNPKRKLVIIIWTRSTIIMKYFIIVNGISR